MAKVHFETEDTGRKDPNGDIIFKHSFEIVGKDVEIFSLLSDAMHQNDKFKALVILALRFVNTHDYKNCPHCKPQN